MRRRFSEKHPGLQVCVHRLMRFALSLSEGVGSCRVGGVDVCVFMYVCM